MSQHPFASDQLPACSGLDALRERADAWLEQRAGGALAALVCVAVAWPEPGAGSVPDAAEVNALMERLHALAAEAGLAARDGDERLVLFVPAPPTLNHAERVTQRLLRSVPVGGAAVVAGIAHSPAHGSAFDALLSRARRAAGEAQLEGDRDYRVYSPV